MGHGTGQQSVVPNAPKDYVNLMTANVYGLYTARVKCKVDFIRELAIAKDVSVICIQETYLSETIRDAEIAMDGYDLIRAERSADRGRGGVAIYIRENSSWNVEVLLRHSNSFVEVLGILVKPLNLFLINIYRPPKCPPVLFKEALNKVVDTLERLPAPLPEVVLVGDVNLPHMNWSEGRAVGGPAMEKRHAELMGKLMEDLYLSQYVTAPTREDNILDVVLCNNDELVEDIQIDKTSFSDHRWVFVTTNIRIKQNEKEVVAIQRSAFDELNFQSDRVNWIGLKDDLSSVDWVNLMRGLSVEEKYSSFIDRTLEMCKKHVPLRHVHGRKQLIPKDRRALMRVRTKLRRKVLHASNHHNVALIENKILLIEDKLRRSIELERHKNELRPTQAI